MTARQVLTVAEVANRLGYCTNTVRAYVRCEPPKLPPPLNLSLPARMWRWAQPVIEAYERGEWKPAQRGLRAAS